MKMVVRLTALQIQEVLAESEPETLEAFHHWAKPDMDFLARTFSPLVQSGLGVAYGLLFENEWVGVLLGLTVPDMVSGQPQGLVCHWVVNKSAPKGGLGLLRAFERECKARGCKSLVAGCISNNGSAEKMRRLYERLGYKPVREEFLKNI